MRNKLKIIVCLLIFVLAAAGCSRISESSNSVLQFFGFNRPTESPAMPQAPAGPAATQNDRDKPQADPDPFASSGNSGSSLADLDWDDDIDPALIDFDAPDPDAKISGQGDWEDDPYAYSFSPSSFTYDDEDETKNEEKQAAVPQEAQNAPQFGQAGSPWKPPIDEEQNNRNQVNNPPQPPLPQVPQPQPQQPQVPQPQPQPQQPQVPQPQPQMPGPYTPPNTMTFYRLRQNPVFHPMCELPRTGFPTGFKTEVRESVKYAQTNMTISVPTLNISEKIVIVPLVGDTFPVESLGDNIGLLEGSGPGKEDLFVLAAHNHLNTQEQGPFAKLSAMKESDLIFIQGAGDASRTFVVYANEKFASDDIDGLVTYAKPGCMILITCEDESMEGGYLNRRVVFAEAKED